MAKLRRRDVLAIRDAFCNRGESTRDLARTYGVNVTTIQSIVTGRSWGHLGPKDTVPTKNRRLSKERVEQIKAEYSAGGISQGGLAKKYGIEQSTVSRIMSGEYYGRRAVGL